MPIRCASLVVAWGLVLGAWSGHENVAHGLRVFVAEIPDVADPEAPAQVVVTLENRSGGELSGILAVRDLVDAWRVVGPAERPFRLADDGRADVEFAISSGPPVYAALYPVHVYATLAGGEVVHAVRIFRVGKALPKVVAAEDAVPLELPVLRLPADGTLALWRQRDFRVGWKYFGGEPVTKPVRWLGNDPVSRASAAHRTLVRGDSRAAINLHPPWTPGGGSVWMDYRVELPEARPVRLRFATAIRDHADHEPGSDGVSFRVWVFADTPPEEPLFERFSDAKVWEDAELDLSGWAGQTVTLRLESHPGPHHDTSCDSSYWAEPLLLAGEALTAVPPGQEPPGADLLARVRAVAAGTVPPDGRESFRLEGAVGGPFAALVVPGRHGLLDGWFLFSDGGEVTGFAGLQVEIEEAVVGGGAAEFSCREATSQNIPGGRRYGHRLAGRLGGAEVAVAVRSEGPGLRVAVSGDRRISLLGPQVWDRPAHRVYWGHGYVVQRPEAFRITFGGHRLSTSHVAFETEAGLAVLMASDTPPSHLEYDPAHRVQGLCTRMDSLLTFVPAQGGMNAAIAYRPLYDKEPAGAVPRLAGRFLFDIWGGRYGQISERMHEAVRYGMTDSILTIHNWQRWGYDYRLPDIWPPNPAFGTLDELREIGRLCRERDIPWGLHDNYIDFYPDADGFSYENIYFTRDGRPHPAWHNKGRDAYSYKFRPDRIQPFVERNFRLLKAGLAPTHSFLDVFTSTPCVDWWDWDGNFHSGLETRRLWGETFAWIRDFLEDAPTTSEAGHDQLIGYLDGADCQWLHLSPQPDRFEIRMHCEDWQRVPWYDAVNHARFVLMGAGYSGRYQAGRDRVLHGINSDDYMGIELLAGHSLMADSGSWGWSAVRKYYLLQDVARRLALRNIVSSEFVGGDIHRQRVIWDEGTVVHVNRGREDWTVDGRVLPPYGFLATNGDWYAAVERRRDAYAESSRGESGWFCDARTHSLHNRRRVFAQPRVENFTDMGGGVFTYDCVWQVNHAHRLSWRAFVHFTNDADEEANRISFQDDHQPAVPTEEWEAGMTVRSRRRVEIPETASGRYHFLVGMYGQEGRASLDGVPFEKERVLVGTLAVERGDDGVEVRFVPAEGVVEPVRPPTNPPGTVVDFGFARTTGACRIVPVENGLDVTPLPNSPAFSATLRLAQLAGGRVPQVASVTAEPLDEAAQPVAVPFRQTGGELALEHDPAMFAYRIRW